MAASVLATSDSESSEEGTEGSATPVVRLQQTPSQITNVSQELGVLEGYWTRLKGLVDAFVGEEDNKPAAGHRGAFFYPAMTDLGQLMAEKDDAFQRWVKSGSSVLDQHDDTFAMTLLFMNVAEFLRQGSYEVWSGKMANEILDPTDKPVYPWHVAYKLGLKSEHKSGVMCRHSFAGHLKDMTEADRTLFAALPFMEYAHDAAAHVFNKEKKLRKLSASELAIAGPEEWEKPKAGTREELLAQLRAMRARLGGESGRVEGEIGCPVQ